MRYIYGRYSFDKVDHAKELTKIYASFISMELSKDYCINQSLEVFGNVVSFVYDAQTEELLFVSEKNNKREFQHLEKTYVFDCKKEEEIKLSDLWISEKDIISAIKNLIKECE